MTRYRLVLALSGCGLVLACVGLAREPDLVKAPGVFLGLFAIAFVGYAAGLWALARIDLAAPAPLALVLGVAAVTRIILLPAPPTLSTDAYRYVWDARVTIAGISPYAHAATAPEVEHLRDATIFPRLNHPTWRTLYPPAAQAFFLAVYGLVPDSVLAMKVALGLVEVAAVGALIRLVAVLGLPAWRVAIYAWNPLVLVEIWGSAHLDALVVAALIGAVLAAVRQRPLLAAGLLAAGTLVKLYPAALLPLLLGPGRWSAIGVFGSIILIGYAPFARLGLDALGSLPRYLGEEYFNPGLTRTLVDHPALTLLALILWVAWVASRDGGVSLAKRAVWLTGGCVLLSPNIFPWYAVWVVPFLAITPSAPWIAFTGSVALAYTFFLREPWAIPSWARAAQFAPLAIAGLWIVTRRAPLPASRSGSGKFTSP
jgi:hypothetical protein